MSQSYDGSFPVPRSVAEAVFLELREKILLGKLRPGSPLLLKEQADNLGVSIMPVREAIRSLEHEGLVIQEPQRGAIVAPVSAEEMEDIYRVRIALESLAIREAAKRITESDYRYLAGIIDSFIYEHEHHNIRGGEDYHRRFHLDLYGIAQSKTLNRLIPPLLVSCERYRTLSIEARGSVQERGAEHRRILDSCMKGDGEESARLLTGHYTRTISLVREGLKQLTC